MVTFSSRVADAIDSKNSLLCVGLDPDVQRIPAHLHAHPDTIYRFCHEIIAATHDLVAAFKPNIAFFEALGAGGVEILARVMELSPSSLWILDAKRGDIGNTAAAYATAAFDYLKADAITLNPYLGGDSLEPFWRAQNAARFCFAAPQIQAAPTCKNSSSPTVGRSIWPSPSSPNSIGTATATSA